MKMIGSKRVCKKFVFLSQPVKSLYSFLNQTQLEKIEAFNPMIFLSCLGGTSNIEELSMKIKE